MKALTKYISKELIKLQILCQVIFIFLFLMIDFVQKIDNFIEAKVIKAGVIFSYFGYKIPYIMVNMIPVATLISVIILFRLMKNNREIMAIKACGINIIKVSLVVIVISFFISLFAFVLSETLVPYTYSRSNEIWDIEVEEQDPSSFYGSDQIWYKSSDAIYWIKHFDGLKNTMEDPTLYFFDNNFNLIKRIEAKKGLWQEGKWNFEDVIIQELQADGDYNTSDTNNITLDIDETPDTFRKRLREPEEMTLSQLKEEIAKNKGYNNTSYLVDINVKIAFPFISLVLTLLGIPIALELKIGGIPLAVAVGMGLSFLYTVILSISRSLGLAEVFPPFLAAWTANLLFIFVGIYLMMTVEQ